jgi:hypothetical protein
MYNLMGDNAKALFRGKETDVELVGGALVGDKISAAGMLLDPYEAVIENTGDEVYEGIPEDTPDEEWMEDSEEGSFE